MYVVLYVEEPSTQPTKVALECQLEKAFSPPFARRLSKQEGRIRKDLCVGLVKRFILGAVDEVIHTRLHAEGKYDLPSMAEPLVYLFIRGIGCSPRSEAGTQQHTGEVP